MVLLKHSLPLICTETAVLYAIPQKTTLMPCKDQHTFVLLSKYWSKSSFKTQNVFFQCCGECQLSGRAQDDNSPFLRIVILSFH